MLKVKLEYCWAEEVREKAKLPCEKWGVQCWAVGGGWHKALSPQPLGCAVWYRPCLEKKMVGVEKNPLPRNVGLAFSSPVVLLFSKCFVLAFILFCPAGSSLGAFPPPVIPPCISASRCFVGLFVFFSGKIPCLHLTASAKAPRAAFQDPGSPRVCRERWTQGIGGMLLDRGLGQRLGTVLPRKVSQTGGLPCLLELSVFPVACGSKVPCGALWLLCAVASLALITICYSLAAGIFCFELVYSWQQSGGCRSFITCCSAGL